ncbi:MAG TPA: DUF418 domain-containing protein [Bryobacteraceae bacterium]|nr:DUF418 domain-containing protein [Bryobacteraceae bacterium]
MEPDQAGITSGFAAAATAPAPITRIEESRTAAPAPVDQTERITALDSLRGFALLGILLMNIVPFGIYGGAYDNPTVAGGSGGPNLAVWAVLHVLAEGKMRCLFSLVFGASVILLTSRLEKRGDAADIYYRRTLWLLLFGIAHAYLLWLGDILYPYALCALILYPFRRMSARGLLITGSVFLVLTSLAYVGHSFGQRTMLERGRAAIAAEQKGQKLTPEQQDQKREYENWRRFNRPAAEELAKDAQGWRGDPLTVIATRARFIGMFHGKPYYSPMNWDIWSMMFLGMALMKLGVLGAGRSTRAYALMAIVGYGIGIPLNTWTAAVIIRSNFDPVTQTLMGSTYDIGRLSIALGHLGMIMLLCRKHALGWLTSRLGAIGQMAFSNYILQSILCAFFFTGYGLAMYGRLQRYQLYYVVAAIWILQMIVSPIWLRHFRFGPLEWAWRSLTYWNRQPMRLLT